MSDNNPPPREPPLVPPTPNHPLNWTRLKETILERKIDFALWFTRLLTMIFALGYIFPLLGLVVIFKKKNSFIDPPLLMTDILLIFN
jgi:uncharacterized RDD family membrane protein YckC